MDSINLNKVDLDFQGKEAYKTLRSNLEFSGKDIKIIGLTSCIQSEGKSSVSMNLAEALADAGNKTILIDADLRKSVLIGRYKIEKPIRGLTHYLAGMNSEQEMIYHTSIDNLDVIFSGPVPPNPSELLGGKMFTDLVHTLNESYDYIVIDTPPLGSIIDGAVVARVCDGMMLVIEANTICYKFAQKVKEQLEKTGCKILGAVLNKVDMSKRGYDKYHTKYGKEYGSGAIVDLTRIQPIK